MCEGEKPSWLLTLGTGFAMAKKGVGGVWDACWVLISWNSKAKWWLGASQGLPSVLREQLEGECTLGIGGC